MSPAVAVGVLLAWSAAVSSVVVLTLSLLLKEQPPAHRVLDAIGLAFNGAVVWLLWPLVGSVAP